MTEATDTHQSPLAFLSARLRGKGSLTNSYRFDCRCATRCSGSCGCPAETYRTPSRQNAGMSSGYHRSVSVGLVSKCLYSTTQTWCGGGIRFALTPAQTRAVVLLQISVCRYGDFHSVTTPIWSVDGGDSLHSALHIVLQVRARSHGHWIVAEEALPPFLFGVP